MMSNIVKLLIWTLTLQKIKAQVKAINLIKKLNYYIISTLFFRLGRFTPGLSLRKRIRNGNPQKREQLPNSTTMSKCQGTEVQEH